MLLRTVILGWWLNLSELTLELRATNSRTRQVGLSQYIFGSRNHMLLLLRPEPNCAHQQVLQYAAHVCSWQCKTIAGHGKAFDNSLCEPLSRHKAINMSCKIGLSTKGSDWFDADVDKLLEGPVSARQCACMVRGAGDLWKPCECGCIKHFSTTSYQQQHLANMAARLLYKKIF